jgi:hypothetical protein
MCHLLHIICLKENNMTCGERIEISIFSVDRNMFTRNKEGANVVYVDVTPCTLVRGCRCFGGTCFFHFQGILWERIERSIFSVDRNMFTRNKEGAIVVYGEDTVLSWKRMQIFSRSTLLPSSGLKCFGSGNISVCRDTVQGMWSLRLTWRRVRKLSPIRGHFEL